MSDLPAELRAMHDRLQLKVHPDGRFKALIDREYDCGAAMGVCWQGADEIERLRDLVHLCSGFLDADSDDPHERAAVSQVIREMFLCEAPDA